MKHVGHTLPKSKTHVDLLKEVFSVWEEFMLDIFEDYAAIGGKFKDFGQEGKKKKLQKVFASKYNRGYYKNYTF